VVTCLTKVLGMVKVLPRRDRGVFLHYVLPGLHGFSKVVATDNNNNNNNDSSLHVVGACCAGCMLVVLR